MPCPGNAELKRWREWVDDGGDDFGFLEADGRGCVSENAACCRACLIVWRESMNARVDDVLGTAVLAKMLFLIVLQDGLIYDRSQHRTGEQTA